MRFQGRVGKGLILPIRGEAALLSGQRYRFCPPYPRNLVVVLVTGTLKLDVKEFLMTTYEQLIQEGRQEGERKGRQEGEQIGASRVLIRLLSKKFPGDAVHLMPLLNQLSPQQQEELGERVLEAHSLDEIREWLKSVCHN
jgi:hypothetical protein